MDAPHNMVIRSKTRQWRIINGWKIQCKDYTNAYYCIDIDNIACLRRELPGTVRDHLYMENYFQSATPVHKAVLQEYRYWEHIVKNQEEVIRTRTLKFNQQYVYLKLAAIFDNYKPIQLIKL